nr:carbohydrate ABC transporter permease [Cohnella fermenti]
MSSRPLHRIADAVIYLVLAVLALVCLAPFMNTLAMSFSASSAIDAREVVFIPKGFHLYAYQYSLGKPEFLRSIGISIERILLGVPLSMLLSVLAAYPLSRERGVFRGRTVYAWIFVFTILFSGGLIPSYMLVYKTGLIDTIGALIIPGAVPVFNIVLLLNFFRGIPKEIGEAAFIDGAGHWKSLFAIYIPLSAAVLATTALFSFVGHWNSWFDGIIYMNSDRNYPLQSYLQTLVLKTDLASVAFNSTVQGYELLSNKNIKAAQVIVGAVPVLIIYPFLQRYFSKGIVLGSVKD